MNAAMRRQRSTGLLLFVIATIAICARPALSDPPKERYVFVENTNRYVGILRGEWELIGKLDSDGEFVKEFRVERVGAFSGGIPAHVIVNFPGLKAKKVYEFRSKMLIPGELQPDGRFVPEAGGKIIPFKDYVYSPTAPRIWNLPGGFVTEEEAAKLKEQKPPEKKE